MLVRLYSLPEIGAELKKLNSSGLEIRRALTPEKRLVTCWIEQNFTAGWADESTATFSRLPVSCFVAVKNGRTEVPECVDSARPKPTELGCLGRLAGFACYDAACRGFFGPIGVSEELRGTGVGKALLLACLNAMRELGYGYAIIGWANTPEFFARTVGATVIEGSDPGIYRGMLKKQQ
ncbi:MAG: GNAT family N-acetyltransferase [bacterium]